MKTIQENDFQRRSQPEFTPVQENRVGIHTWGMEEKIIGSKSDSPQFQFFPSFSEKLNDQNSFFCLPKMIKTDDQNVGPLKNNFINKFTYESKAVEKAKTPKILDSQEEKLGEEKDVITRKSDEKLNHITQNKVTGWGNPMLTNWDSKRQEMMKLYETNQKKLKEENLLKSKTPLTEEEKIINERIIEALDKYDDFQKG
jgi:hypothetical protein